MTEVSSENVNFQHNVVSNPQELNLSNFKNEEMLLTLKNFLEEEEQLSIAQDVNTLANRDCIIKELCDITQSYRTVNPALIINAIQLADRVICLTNGKIEEPVLIATSCYILSHGAYEGEYLDIKGHFLHVREKYDKSYTKYELRNAFIEVCNVLEFRLMNVTLSHFLNLIALLDDSDWGQYESMKCVLRNGSFTDVSHTYIIRKWLICIKFSRFAELYPSLQLIGLLSSFGILDKKVIELLDKTEDEVITASQIVYAALQRYHCFDSLHLPRTKIVPIEHHSFIFPSAKRGYPNKIVEMQEERFFERFSDLKEVGKGVYGDIFACTDTNSQERVALKIIRADNMFTVMDWIGEISYFSYLQNIEGLNQYMDMFYTRPRRQPSLGICFCIVMPLYLCDARNAPPSLLAPKFDVKRILNGLRQIHLKGFTHGDIKPENILLNDYYNCCLTDFGMLRRHPFGNGILLSYTPTFCCLKYLETLKSSPSYDLYALVMTLLNQYNPTKFGFIRRIKDRIVRSYKYEETNDLMRRAGHDHIAQSAFEEATEVIKELKETNPKFSTILLHIIETSSKEAENSTATCTEWLNYLSSS